MSFGKSLGFILVILGIVFIIKNIITKEDTEKE